MNFWQWNSVECHVSNCGQVSCNFEVATFTATYLKGWVSFSYVPLVKQRVLDLSKWCAKIFLRLHNTFSSVPSLAINNGCSRKAFFLFDVQLDLKVFSNVKVHVNKHFHKSWHSSGATASHEKHHMNVTKRLHP